MSTAPISPVLLAGAGLVVATSAVVMAIPAQRIWSLDQTRAQSLAELEAVCSALESHKSAGGAPLGTLPDHPRPETELDAQPASGAPATGDWATLEPELPPAPRCSLAVWDTGLPPDRWYVRSSCDLDEDGQVFVAYCLGPALQSAGSITRRGGAGAPPVEMMWAGRDRIWIPHTQRY